MFPYGITPEDLRVQSSKRETQREFLANSTFTTSSGSVKTLLDINMNANISQRYYAQLVNKVNTLQQVMSNENLMPIFLTITHDGWLQRLFTGDYSKFEDEKHLKKLPENDKYGYLKTKALRRETFDEHDFYMILRWNWERFGSERTSRKMREVSKIGYIFATEPHESGIPHAHVLMYIPSEFRDDLLQDFKRIFDAPRNIAQTKRKRNNKNGLTREQIKNGEINGFQWTLSNPVGYILKYVTKSFMDIKNQADIDELNAWYMKHRISRISTSHSLVPQWVYQKIYPLESDWLYLTNLKNDGVCEWSQEDDYFKFEDIRLEKTFLYSKGVYQYFINGTLEREFGSPKEDKAINTMFQPERPITSLVPRPLRHSVTVNGQFDFIHKGDLNIDLWQFIRNKIEFNFYPISTSAITFTGYSVPLSQRRAIKHEKNIVIEVIRPNRSKYRLDLKGQVIKPVPTPVRFMTNFDLYSHYIALNPETCNLQRFGILQNECVKRGLVQGSISSLNDFTTDWKQYDLNPFADEFDRVRSHFSACSAVNSLVSLQNIISNIGA